MIEVAKQHKFGLTAGLIAALVLIAAAAYGLYSLLRGKPHVPFENFTIAQITDNGKTTAAAISADAKYLLSVIDDNGKQSLWLRHLPTNSDTQVIAPADAIYESLAFSPNGDYIYFLRELDKVGELSDLLRAPVLGGAPQMIVHDVDSRVSFSPDGQRFAFVRGMDPDASKFQLLTADADGTNEHAFADGPAISLSSAVAWSPDGKQVAYVTPSVDGALSVVQIQDMPSAANKKVLKFNNVLLNDLVWVPGARGLIATYQQNATPYVRNQIAFVSEPAGEFRPITRDTNNYQSLSVSADGRTLATIQQRATQTFYMLPAAGFTGNTPEPAPAQVKDALFFGWAANSGLYFDDVGSLVRISTGGGDKTNILTDSTAQIIQPLSCRDGRYIVFSWAGHSGGNQTNIWRLNADGSDPKRLSDGAQDIEPECSPDGKWVFYDDVQDFQVKRVPLDGGTPEIVPGSAVPSGFFHYGLSAAPDGKLLAFLTVETQHAPAHQIALVPLDAGPATTRRMIDPDPRVSDAPRFTPDGSALVYPIRDRGTDNLWLQPLNGSPGRQLTNFTSDTISAFRYSPDGKSIGVLRSHLESDVVLLRDTDAAPH